MKLCRLDFSSVAKNFGCSQYSSAGGKTPFTWYAESYLKDVAMTDMRMRPDPQTGYPGRTYRFYTGKPIFHFGYGLSYGHFKLHFLRAPAKLSIELQADHPCRFGMRCKSIDLAALGASGCSTLLFDVHLQVSNAGAGAGSHSVLLFHTPPQVHGAPRKQLVGFEKVSVAAGGAEDVVLKMDACRDLSVVDEEGNRKLALGSHVLAVGDLNHAFTIDI